MTVDDKLLTPAQVADKLQVTEKTVRRWLKEGDLVGIKLGQFWRIKPENLETFLQKHARQ